MNKNGFTLIEMIATLALMAMLVLIILVNMSGFKNDEENSEAKSFEEYVSEAACSYIDLSDNTTLRRDCKQDSATDVDSAPSKCKISLSSLISSNVALIDENEKDLYTNKLAKEEADDVFVWVHWVQEDGYKVKKCDFYRN